MDQFHPAPVRLCAFADGLDRQRAPEVVDDGQQVEQEAFSSPVGHLATVAVDALAEVVELGGGAQQAIAQLLALVDGLGLVVSCGGRLAGVGGGALTGIGRWGRSVGTYYRVDAFRVVGAGGGGQRRLGFQALFFRILS